MSLGEANKFYMSLDFLFASGWLVRLVKRSMCFHLLGQMPEHQWLHLLGQMPEHKWFHSLGQMSEHNGYTITPTATTNKSIAKDYIIFVLTKSPATA